MKKVTLLLLLSTLSLSVIAQEKQDFKNIIGISPLQLFNGVRIKYERTLNEKITYGGILTGYYPNPAFHSYTGVQIAPTIRGFFKENAPKGFYVQAKILGGIYSAENTIEIYDKPYSPDYERIYIKSEDRIKKFASFGVGMAIGFQTVWGEKKRMILDMNLGLKYMGNSPSPKLKDNEERFPDTKHLNWYVFGPASIVDGLISIGYRF